MKILFVTLVATNNIQDRGLYNDLLRKFYEHGHEIYVVAPLERRKKLNTRLIVTSNTQILNVKTLNIQKTNLIEKGLGTLLIEFQYLSAIKKYFKEVKFDLILYSTPPITFTKVITFIKNRDCAFAYLLLKDIFPQNAVDISLLKKDSLLHRFFKQKEEQLYKISDKIGCMSPANVDFILKHNLYLSSGKVEVCPNSIEPITEFKTDEEKLEIRREFGIPIDKTVFIYGGNLGKPQGIDFLIEVLESNLNNLDCYFLVVGDGTEYNKLESWFKINKPTNSKLLQSLPKNDFDNLLSACDVGMIFLDVRFTIPNFPSRMLSYMENQMPIIAATDLASDIGKTIVEGDFGYWSASNDIKVFNANLKCFFDTEKLKIMGENARHYLEKHFTPSINYEIILRNFDTLNAIAI